MLVTLKLATSPLVLQSFFAGLSPAKALRMLNHMNVQNISYATYMNHQTKYLVPSVNDVYKIEHENVIKSILEKQDEKGIVALGDGRADSPGHSAKYGTYTVMEKSTKKIIAAQLVQSNEVGSSTAMEKEGLKRSLEQLSAEGVNIGELVTDRHVSIRKMMRENHPEIRHSVDVWHVDKGIGKKLNSAGKERGCKLIAEWKPAISKHLYWCANRGNGNPDVVSAAWKALGNHIINVHTHSDPLFTECQHGELEERKWFLPHSKAYCKLREILFSNNMLKDVKQLTPNSITAGVESFHSLFNHMAPKMLHYHYETFYARYKIAILHFNENCNRKQARTKSGDERYNVKYPKYKKGSHTLCKVFEKATFNYAGLLMKRVCERVTSGDAFTEDRKRPPPLASKATRVLKQFAVQQHKTRFMKNG